MSDILVLARTRMRNGNICVGAIDMETGRLVRPLTDRGQNFVEAAPWTVGDIWRVIYVPKQHRTPPHIEDVRILRMNRVGQVADIQKWFRDGLQQARIFTGSAEGLYDGTLTFEHFAYTRPDLTPRSARLDEGRRQPSMSLQLWETDRVFVRHDAHRDGQWQVRYIGGSPTSGGVSFSMKHVGYTTSSLIIEKGALVSLSLARWWPRPDRSDGREACYLQLCDVLTMPVIDNPPTHRVEEEPVPW